MSISNAPRLNSFVHINAQDDAPYINTGNTTALKIFILNLRLISILPQSLRRCITKVLVAIALLFSICCRNFPLLVITLPRYVKKIMNAEKEEED